MKKIIYWIPYVPIIGLLIVSIMVIYDIILLKTYNNFCFDDSNVHNVLSCTLQFISIVLLMGYLFK